MRISTEPLNSTSFGSPEATSPLSWTVPKNRVLQRYVMPDWGTQPDFDRKTHSVTPRNPVLPDWVPSRDRRWRLRRIPHSPSRSGYVIADTDETRTTSSPSPSRSQSRPTGDLAGGRTDRRPLFGLRDAARNLRWRVGGTASLADSVPRNTAVEHYDDFR
jgi:hypothetical protein